MLPREGRSYQKGLIADLSSNREVTVFAKSCQNDYILVYLYAFISVKQDGIHQTKDLKGSRIEQKRTHFTIVLS